MTTYEENLHVLAQYYPGMDIMIEEAKKNMKPEIEIIEEVSFVGDRILKIKKGGKAFYLNGKRETREPARMWISTLGELQRNAPVVLVGVGNPLYLQELVEQTNKRVAIIVYEPSLQIFLKFLEMVKIEKWMEKHLIVFWVEGLQDMDKGHMREMLEKVLTYEMLRFFRNLVLPNYDKLFKKEVIEFMELCRDIAMIEVVGFNTKDVFSSVMVKNLFSNARYLCDGYKTTQLPAVIPDIPGILVAAGPSLNKNIHELKKAKGKAFIVAVDTAIKPLIRAGIVPDMFAIIDGMKPLELVEIEEARDIPLLAMLNAASEVLEYHKGMKFFYNQGFQFTERIFAKSGQPISALSSGGSVATSIFSFLYKIGINTVILVGQDLAYTDNKSHADGTFKEIMEEVDTSRFKMVEGNYEKSVPTREDFLIFIEWYNRAIELYKERNNKFRVINATEGGAKIKNTEIMTLREAIERECKEEVDVQKCLKKLSPMLDEEARLWAVSFLQDMPNMCRQLKKNAKIIKGLYNRLNKICDKRHIDVVEYRSILKKLKNQIEKIEEMSAYQLIELSMNNAQYILKGEQFLSEDSVQAEGKEIARKGILYMEKVSKMAEIFEEYSKEVFGEEFKKRFGSINNGIK